MTRWHVHECGVDHAEPSDGGARENGVGDLAAVTIMIPDKCGRRLETVRVGECVLTQPAITITIPDEMLVARRESACACLRVDGHHDHDSR